MDFIINYKILKKYKHHLLSIIYQNMSHSDSGSQKLITGRQQSFYITVNEHDDVPPEQLSGDQSTQKSLLLSNMAAGAKANFLLTVTIIMKTVIGAGILALPYTISTLGYAFGLLVYVIVVAINQFTSYMLLLSKNLSRHSNYSTIMYHIFESKLGQAFCSALILVNNLGICIAELTIFKEGLHSIFNEFLPEDTHDNFYVQPWFFVIVLLILQAPSTLISKIQKLKFMSFLGVSGIVIFIICLMVNFFNEMIERDWILDEQMQPFPRDWTRVASVIPNIMLALAYQMNFFPIFKGLKNSNDQKMNKAAATGLWGVAACYILVGMVGYALYGSKLQTNFLLNLQYEQLNPILYFGMNIGFLVSIFFSFPIMFFGARNNFIALMKMYLVKKKKIATENFTDSVQQISSYIEHNSKEVRRKKAKIHFYAYTAFLYLIVVVIAITVDDLESVFNLVGAIASNAIGYILPCLFYFLLISYKQKQKNIKFYIAKFLAFFFIPFGIFAIVSKYIWA